MKKRYDAVIIGSGLAAYALAALASRQGHVLVFETDARPVEPPWFRPLMATGPGSAWAAFASRLELKLPDPLPYRFQVLGGRDRPDGRQPPEPQPFDTAQWLASTLAWPPWYRRFWQALVLRRTELVRMADVYLAQPSGYLPSDLRVQRYLAATVPTWATPAGNFVDLLLALRTAASNEGAEFLPAWRLAQCQPGKGIKVEGAAALLRCERMAVCLDVSQWSEAPGLGPIPRHVYRYVRPVAALVRAEWPCEDAELPVGLAARGAWVDKPCAYFEVLDGAEPWRIAVWTVVGGGPELDATAMAEGMHAVLRSYCPFLRAPAVPAKLTVRPVYQSIRRSGVGVPPWLAGGLAYAGPQSFPGWGCEGELAAALRVANLWFPDELG